MGRSRRFRIRACLQACRKRCDCKRLQALRKAEASHMHFADQIRCRPRVGRRLGRRLGPRGGRILGLCSLLLLSLHAIAFAQTESATPPKKTPQASATHSTTQAVKPKHSTTARAATGHASTASARKTKTKTTPGKKGSRQVARKRGQQAIDSGRAREIQTALIREHYMDGEPSGSWDSATQAAMQRYQADQGWQSKTTPDARALIKLGLGPSHDHLLNPESAMTTTPAAPAADDPKAASKPLPAQTDLPQQ
jgi:putative peptidoglycan binding protein